MMRRASTACRAAAAAAIAILFIPFLPISHPVAAASGPPPPQGPGVLDDKGEQAVAIDPGSGLFVDPGGFGYCRAVQVPASAPLQQVIPLFSSAEWDSWRSNPPAGDSQTVCCRPTAVSLCAGATNPQSGALPYTVLGQTGSASATCIDSYGQRYPDTQSSVCGSTDSVNPNSVMADGLWGPITDNETIPAPPCTAGWVSYGGCSTAGGSGWGVLWEYVYNSCGQLTSQGWFGPSCYTPPPCTPNWVKIGCSATTGIWEDIACGSGVQYWGGTCTETPYSCVVGGTSCQVCSYAYEGWEFTDCSCYGWTTWGSTNGSETCNSFYEYIYLIANPSQGSNQYAGPTQCTYYGTCYQYQ